MQKKKRNIFKEFSFFELKLYGIYLTSTNFLYTSNPTKHAKFGTPINCIIWKKFSLFLKLS